MTARLHSNKDGGLELRAADIGEGGILPDGRWKIPTAGAGFAIVSTCSELDGRGTPVIESYLQKGPGRNFYAGAGGATFQLAGGQCRAGRRAPEMPDPVASLSHAEHHSLTLQIVSQGNGIVCVGREPGLTLVKASA